MRLSGLSRQIALSMIKIALGTAFLVTLGSFAFYYIWNKYWPSNMPSESDFAPSLPEWAWIAATFSIAIVVSISVAVKLSKRILEPLNSVAEGIRGVAKGDLAVRATVGDRSLGEAASLADDFNFLAEKLQQMTDAQAFWNAAIAHELRTPVTILRGRLQGLAEGIFTPDKDQFIKLLTQVDGLSRLIDDLRVVSLMNSGELHINKTVIDITAEIKTVVDLAENILQIAGQQVHIDAQVIWVHCDAVRIRQALLAILENASRYAVAGIIRIQTRHENGFYYLSIEDDGPGISPELIEHVFVAFYRATEVTNSGSGLGLAVVAAISHAHQGDARCYVSAAGGTVIELRWPSV